MTRLFAEDEKPAREGCAFGAAIWRGKKRDSREYFMAGNMRRRQCNSCKTSSSSSFISKDQKKKKKTPESEAEKRQTPCSPYRLQNLPVLGLFVALSLSHGTYSYIFYLLVCWAAFLSFLSNTCRDLSSHSNIHRVMILIGVDNEAGPRLRAR